MGIKYVFSPYGDTVSFFSQYSDTLYVINSEAIIEPRYYINYGNNNQELSMKFVNTVGPNKINDFRYVRQIRNNSGIYHLYRQLQTDEHIILSGVIDGETYTWIYCKSSGKSINMIPFKNDLLRNIIYNTSDHKYFYSCQFASFYINASSEVKSYYSNELFGALEKAKNDNPIILIFKFNTF